MVQLILNMRVKISDQSIFEQKTLFYVTIKCRNLENSLLCFNISSPGLKVIFVVNQENIFLQIQKMENGKQVS